ncbi:MAG: glycoside hydrolase family 19 protein [Gammaproteobacteria bacterium]
MLNRDFFFVYVRQHLFDGRLKLAQVHGLIGILDEWEARYAKKDDRWLAYMLATAHHETDRTMQPIREYGGQRWYRQMYDVSGARPQLAARNGNTAPGDGLKYYGRGFVQLTWKNNYARAGTALGVDLVGQPDLALDPALATRIMFLGMQRGWFTGRKLADSFNPQRGDWVGARRIINGTDKANLIAGYGQAYYAALSYTT